MPQNFNDAEKQFLATAIVLASDYFNAKLPGFADGKLAMMKYKLVSDLGVDKEYGIAMADLAPVMNVFKDYYKDKQNAQSNKPMVD